MKRILPRLAGATALLVLALTTQAALAQRKPAVPPGFVLRHGDILVRASDLNGGSINSVDLWPNGIVPYEFDSNVTNTNETLMEDAMAEWEAVADVDFQQCANDNCSGDYVHIQDSDANNSSVGRIGGEQIINIFNWGTHFKIVHELGHCLGLYHEQTRPDRDNFVTVNFENILDDKEHNYDLEAAAFAWPKMAYGLPDDETYDYLSVMHYDDDAFCIDTCPGPTMTTADPDYQDLIGQRDSLSTLDRLAMSLMYPENDVAIVDKTSNEFLQIATLFYPFQDLTDAYDLILAGNTLAIMPGDYNGAARVYTKAMTLKAPLGNVVMGDGSLGPVAGRAEEAPALQPAPALNAGTEADGDAAALPTRYTLEGNYPNPFNPATTIRYGLPEAAHVRLVVYNLLGQEVARLAEGAQEAGWHAVSFDARHLSSGVYLYRLEAGTFTQTRQMVLLQ
jgi:hypothetical protein